MNHAKLNPLTVPFGNSYGALPFDRIRTEHYLPALRAGIERAKARLSQIRDAEESPTFENTVVALETCSESVDLTAEVFFNLLSAEAGEGEHAVAKEFSPLVASFANDILLDEKLFARVKAVHEKRASLKLTNESLKLLEKSHKNFVRNGAQLGPAKKQRLREIDNELAKLSPQFSENVLKATYAVDVHVTDRAELTGLPESALEAAAAAAQKKEKLGWIFTLEAPSYSPVITYAENRALREKMYRAYNGRARTGEFDNRAILKSIAELRHERAEVLGFATHADYVLQERMAGTKEKVLDFLEKLLKVAKPAADKEVEAVRRFARERDGLKDFQPWDFAFYAEKLKERDFSFNEEELRPYFKLENVIQGAFDHASKLFGLTFKPLENIPLYHPDVKVFEVRDRARDMFIGLLYTDFFPRPTKKGGAWMTALREQGLFAGVVRRPHVSIVCNFTKPTATKPSLLSFQEVLTLFHEFGHALHGLLSECRYRSVAGTNVYWDFVELPSQLMENWVFEKEVLDSFALHYETRAKIPAALAKKVKDSAAFQAGYRTLRQISFALLDMGWHGADPSQINDVEGFEKTLMERTRLLPRVDGTNISVSFAHIFAGGYSAGYYSYKWAEVLEADAFEFFKERGLYDSQVSNKLRKEILSRGGTEHPMELYKRFRGREPDTEALLRRDKLL